MLNDMGRKAFLMTTAAACLVPMVPAMAQGNAFNEPRQSAAGEREAESAAVDSQNADTAGNQGEIIVTARRVNERLSNVPASITALDSAALQATGADHAADFIKLTPGVTIIADNVEAGDNQINIRGLNGARDAESSIALVVDGVLKTNSAVLNQDQGSITQVEILKGPQSALYGRNAVAGAIIIQTAKPGDRLVGSLKGSYANDRTIKGSGYIAGPLWDGVGFVLSGDYLTTDGYFRNRFLNDRPVVDYRDTWNLNGRIFAQVDASTTIDLKGHYGELHGASIVTNASFELPAFGPSFVQNVNAHQFNFYSNIVPRNKQITKEASVKIDHDWGNATASAWVNYSDVFNDLNADGTSADFQRFASATNTAVASTVNACFTSTAANTSYPINPPAFIGALPGQSVFGPYSPTTCDGIQYQRRTQKDISTEIRLVSNGDERFDWQIGGYYLNIDREVAINLAGDSGNGTVDQIYGASNSVNPTTQLYYDNFKTNVFAAFGSADYEVSRAFDIGLALRYDIEDRKVRSLVPLVLDPFTGGPINPGQINGAIPDKKAVFRQLEPKVTLRYKVAPDTTIYANWGIGFKSGGFNNQGSAQIVVNAFNNGIGSEVRIDDLYRKERSSAYEAGIKGKFGPIDYSLAGYYTEVRDMQFFEFLVGGFGLLRVVSNIDRVDIKGVEFNTNVRLVKGFDIFGSVNVTDSKIKENKSRPSTVGNKSPSTADYTINLGTQMLVPLSSSVDLLMRADYRITGPTWFHTVQAQSNPTLFGVPGNYTQTQRDAYGVLDLRFGIQTARWNITAFANNALNRHYLNEVVVAPEFGGAFVAPGARARYGLEVGAKF